MSERPTPEVLLGRLVELLDLLPGDQPDRFVGRNVPVPGGRVFGGQVLGQSLVAAGRTVPPERRAHSLHAYFLRPGHVDEPITFAVERLRDGRSFTARRTHALQAGQPILSMIASFQSVDDGLEHADPAPRAPEPESLPTNAELLGGIDHPVVDYWAFERPVDVRGVDQPIFLAPASRRSSDTAVWLRAPGGLPDDPLLHAAVLAFASDYTLLESVLRRHGLAWSTPGLKLASLDHAMWFHRPARPDEWTLYSHHSPSASGGRALVNGSMHDRQGTLVATVAQEGMIRLPSTAG